MTSTTNAMAALLQGAVVVGLMVLVLLVAGAVTKLTGWATRQHETAQPAVRIPAQRGGEHGAR